MADPLAAFTNEPVSGAGTLSERELAVLLLYPADPEGQAELQGAYEEARKRAQEILDLAVATREGRTCDYEDCQTPAAFTITPEGEGDPLQACQGHLGALMQGEGLWQVAEFTG